TRHDLRRRRTHERRALPLRDRRSRERRTPLQRGERRRDAVRDRAHAAGALVTAPPVFGWARAAKATYYNLQLYRNGVKILSVWPTGRAFALKRSWAWAGKRYTFGAGSYHWYVWPGYGRQAKRTYGALLGDSVFQVQP